MNRRAIQRRVAALTAAQARYDAALRARAGLRRAAAAAGAQVLPTTLAQAERALATARQRVQAARTTLDDRRLQELANIGSAPQLLGALAGNAVLALFPVGVEARLEPGRLRLRVWPDAVSTSTHDPRLSETELAAGKRYWRAVAVAVGDAERRAAWRALADEVGVTRAAWAAQRLEPTNRALLSPTVAPEFPTVEMDDDEAPHVPRAGVLPDRWIVVGQRDGQRVFEQMGAPIPLDLAVGLDTTPEQAAGLANREGEPIALPPRMRWMTDFATAVQVGMALDIALAPEVDRLDSLWVLGVRVTQTAAQGADSLAALFAGHRFSRGLAFVPQDTPTNNSSAGGSGMPGRAQRIDTAFDVERGPRAFGADAPQANGVAAARAFGLPADTFAAVAGSGAVAAVAQEPQGFERAAAHAMQTLLWPVTIGAGLEDFLQLPPGRADALRAHFCGHVQAAGPVPAFRVGRQPYGVLPVTAIDGFVARADEGLDAGLLPLLRAARTWFAMRRLPAQYDGTPAQALRHLGRSTALYAETTRQDAASTAPDRWQTLAATLAVASRNTIRDTWRNVRITGTVDGVPEPVERPIVDAATAAELAALAAAGPLQLLAAPLPATVLGRIARQAALLEWSRLARQALVRVADIPTRRDLAEQAAERGSDVYLHTLAGVFAARPPGPVDPVRRVSPEPPIRSAGLSRPAPPPLRARPNHDGPIDPREPPEPPPPREPRPPPQPPGEPELNAQEREALRALVGALAEPLPSCPGAARLAAFRQALARLAEWPPALLEAEFFRTLDLCHHRVDAWCTSVATRRLHTLRSAAPQGVVIGGWGVLQDVRRADPADPRERAEFIHAPSLDHAAAAAVLRSGARRARGEGSAHADIDLSSRRVRLARWVLDGVRNGRSLSDLLGARFERALKGTPAEAQLGALRARFPGHAGQGVLDGLRLLVERPPGADEHVARAAAVVDEAVDAVADALTAEAVYQLVRGQPLGALVDLEALAAGAPAPPLRVTETPPAGTRLTHRVGLVLPVAARAPGWPPPARPRALAEPLLEAWCGWVLGPAAGHRLAVVQADGSEAPVPLSTLGLAALDVVFEGRHGGAGLRAHIAWAAGGAPVREDRAWTDLLGLCDAAARVITRGHPLRPESFEAPSALPAATDDDPGDLPARVAQAQATLAAARDRLASPADPRTSLLPAAAFGIHVPGLQFGAEPSPEQRAAALAAIDTRLAAAAAASTPRDRLGALFGGELPGVVGLVVREPPAAARPAGADPADANAWLDACARTRPGAAALAELLLRRAIVAADSGPAPLAVAQLPWREGDHWIATAFGSSTGQPPLGRLSLLLHAPAGFDAGVALGGLLVDAWTETIPTPTRDTAMALRFNNASTRAPQVVLLAVSPDPSAPWTTETLVDILDQTLMLTRMRMQPPSDWSRGGLMPSAWLGQRPGGTGISFSL